MNPPRHLLVAIDFGPCTEPVLHAATEIAKTFGARITLLHTVELGLAAYPGAEFVSVVELMQAMTDSANARLGPMGKRLEASGISKVTTEARYGVAWEQITSAATTEHADLIVMGTHGRRGVPRALLGSTAEKVVRTASIPVLTLHAG